MTNDDEATNITNRSGGADLNAEGDVNVGGDVVGRDKYVIVLPPSAPVEKTEDARTTHIRQLIDLANSISKMADDSLLENEETLLPFLRDPANHALTRDALLGLFHKQKQRGQNKQFLTLLDAYIMRETEPQLKDILEELNNALSDLYQMFYGYDGPQDGFRKHDLVRTFEIFDEVNTVQLRATCESYLEHMRLNIEIIAASTARLKSLLQV